jgi:predicted PurR-regulated permease PerM
MSGPEATPGRLRSLVILIAVVLVLGFLVFHHFLLIFAVAGPIAMFLAPVHRTLTRWLGGRRAAAAALLVLVSTGTLLLPVLGSATLLTRQAVDFFEWARPRLQPEALQTVWTQTIPARYPWLRAWFDFDEKEWAGVVSEGLSGGVTTLNQVAQGAVARVTTAFFDLGLFLLLLFFLLRDGPTLRHEIGQLSPLSTTQEDHIIDHLQRTVSGVLRAMVMVPLAQGVVAFPAFIIFGVPAPLLWSVVVVLAALVPILGSPLGWLPAVAYLYATGETWQWVGLLIYGAVIISGIDNLVKPYLLRDVAQIHPLLGFLSILGGVMSFGPLGVLVGPVILSLVLSALKIYKLDVLRVEA